MRPMGWLISVEVVDGTRQPLYATVADSYEQARLQVFNQCSLSNEVIRLERILNEPEIKHLSLHLRDLHLKYQGDVHTQKK